MGPGTVLCWGPSWKNSQAHSQMPSTVVTMPVTTTAGVKTKLKRSLGSRLGLQAGPGVSWAGPPGGGRENSWRPLDFRRAPRPAAGVVGEGDAAGLAGDGEGEAAVLGVLVSAVVSFWMKPEEAATCGGVDGTGAGHAARCLLETDKAPS